jgi:HAD superfamily hydrolase (TIGR01549 family)
VGLVLLDLDGTLVDQASAARAWPAEFVETWALPAEEMEPIARTLTARTPKDRVFAELVGRLSLSATADSIWRAYRQRMPELVTCDADDLNALDELREAGWALAIVTNGMADNQEGKIRRLGLDRLVDDWVISSDVGVRKPDPEIFRAAATRLGMPLDGWMVGDSLEQDVAGAAAVGLRTVWIADEDSDPKTYRPNAVASTVAKAALRILREQDDP